jgi:sugar phosphate permease
MIARGADAIRVRKGFTVAGLAVASTEIIGVMSGSRELAVIFAVISLSGLGLATANYWALTQTLMPGAAIGRIAGVQNFASNLSGIVAPILTGRLVAWTGSYEAPMQAIALLLMAGIAAYVFLVRKELAPRPVSAQTAEAAS